MRILELFAGTRSIGRAFESRGYEVTSIDWNEEFIDCIHCDAYDFLIEHGGEYDVFWASPDCTTYSIAGGSSHRLPNYVPKTDYAQFCDTHNKILFSLFEQYAQEGKLVFIENPRGMMRKMPWAQNIPRYTVTYCQYGDTRMKPTDLWTNHPNPNFKPMCKNGDMCHTPAPRGSRTGTQGLKFVRDRSRIPKELCEHIVDLCEDRK